MCLVIDKDMTEKMQRELAEKGKLTCYKVYKATLDGDILSPYMDIRVKPNEDGVIVSDRALATLKDLESRWQSVESGIHVYLNEPKVDSNWFAIPATVLPEDFVAAGTFNGDHAAVFTKIRVDNEQLKQLALDHKHYDEDDDDDYDDDDDDDYEDDEDDEDEDEDYDDDDYDYDDDEDEDEDEDEESVEE